MDVTAQRNTQGASMIRALLVIDVPFYRDGLATLLNQSTDVTVVASVAGSAPVLALVARESPDVILLDISAAGARDTLQALLAVGEPPKVVVLAITETPECVAEWAALGALGYVSRNASLADLLHCLRCAARGEAYCSPRVMAMLLRGCALSDEWMGPGVSRRAALGGLTAREREILELMGNGLSNKLIAARLHISYATAKNHVHHILDKLRLRSRAQIAAYLHTPSATPTNGLSDAVRVRTARHREMLQLPDLPKNPFHPDQELPASTRHANRSTSLWLGGLNPK